MQGVGIFTEITVHEHQQTVSIPLFRTLETLVTLHCAVVKFSFFLRRVLKKAWSLKVRARREGHNWAKDSSKMARTLTGSEMKRQAERAKSSKVMVMSI